MHALFKSSWLLAAAPAFWSQSIAYPTIPPRFDTQSLGPKVLRPINIRDYEAAVGLHRRDNEEFSDLNLETQSQLIYGSPGNNGQVLLANMTLYAPDGLQMIMMERFEGLTTAVDCRGDDGSMSLTFKSQDAFNYALKTWSYINQNDNDRFLLIANHNGCGPDDQRQPYLITKVTEDTQDLTTFLTAQVASWSEVAGTYDLDFGKAYSSAPAADKLKERDWLGDVSDFGGDIVDGAKKAGTAVVNGAEDVGDAVDDVAHGNADLSKSVTFPMNVGTENQRTNIYTDSKGRLKLDCINCYVTGSFQVTGHLKVEGWKIKDFSIDASPSGFAAELEMEAVITASKSPEALQFSKELFSFPIPDAGIEVPGIMTLGATLSYDVGASISFQGTATVDFGLRSTIPDSAKAVLDLGGAGQSSATGFSSTVDPVFDVKQLSASVTLSAFSKPKLSFGIELTEIGTADVSLSLKLPEVSVTLEADYDEAGVCSQDSGSSKTGVKLSSEVNVELDAGAELKFGDSDKNGTHPSWSKKLWGWTHPLPGACFPIDIPGIGSTATNATKVPTLPSASLTAAASGTGSAATNGTSATSVIYSIPSAVPIRSHSNSLYIPSGLGRTRRSSATGAVGSSGTVQSRTTNLPTSTSVSNGNPMLSSSGSGIASLPISTSNGGSAKNATSATAGQPTNTSNGPSPSGNGHSATDSSRSLTANSTATNSGLGSAHETDTTSKLSSNGTSTVASTTASGTGSGMSATHTSATEASHTSRFSATTSATGTTSLTHSSPSITASSPSSPSPSPSSSPTSSRSSHKSDTPPPATTTPPSPSHTDTTPAKAKHDTDEGSYGSKKETKVVPKPDPTTSSTTTSSPSSTKKKTTSTETPATGGGGCKMRRGENGKRMLVC